jgi:biopolymer transport protein ExbD
MISRPLDLASKLRRPPRNFDWLFFVNVGLIALFFGLFGSRFVLVPALGVDFRLPEMPGATPVQVTQTINVTAAGQIFTAEGGMQMSDLRVWLRVQAKSTKEPVLNVIADKNVPLERLTEITSAAAEAGFVRVVAAEEPRAAGKMRDR